MYQRRYLAIAMLAFSPLAHAQKVYKCNEAGQTVYQSLPCALEHDTGVSRPVISDPELTAQERMANEQMLYKARRRMQAEAGRGVPPIRGTVIENIADPEACENERWRRELDGAFGRRRGEDDNKRLSSACQVR